LKNAAVIPPTTVAFALSLNAPVSTSAALAVPLVDKFARREAPESRLALPGLQGLAAVVRGALLSDGKREKAKFKQRRRHGCECFILSFRFPKVHVMRLACIARDVFA
jgi:hypothetical protein